MDTKGVRNYLEIGCGFGFVLDFARHAFGWQVAGIDPGIIARTGERVLDLDIAADYVVPGYDFGGRRLRPREVLRNWSSTSRAGHIPRDAETWADRLGRARVDHAQRRPGGPAGHAPSVLLPILQPGFHLVLLTRESLEDALHRAGFGMPSWEEGAALVAVACARPVAVNRAARVDAGHYRAYLEHAVRYRAPSPLTRGPGVPVAEARDQHWRPRDGRNIFARVRVVIGEVYQIDIGEPESLGLEGLPPLQFLEVGTHMPFCLGGCVLYYRGIAMLIVGRHRKPCGSSAPASPQRCDSRRALHRWCPDDGDSASSCSAVARASADGARRRRRNRGAECVDRSLAPRRPEYRLTLGPPSVLVSRARQETFSRLVSLGFSKRLRRSRPLSATMSASTPRPSIIPGRSRSPATPCRRSIAWLC